MKNILSYLGFNQVTNTRLSLLALDSILSRLCLVSLICVLMLTLGVGNAWGTNASFDYTSSSLWTGWSVTIPANNSTGTDLSTSGSYAVGVVTMTVTHGSSTHTRLWKNSSGTLEFRFYSGATITYSVPSGYKINSITVTTKSSLSVSSPTGGSWSSNTWSPKADTDPTSVVFSASGSVTWTSVTVSYESTSATCTLHHGAGGSSTTNKTQGSGTLGSGSSVTGWSFVYWCTTSFADSYYPNHGTTYNSSATTPAQANLYAVYQNNCTYRYSTSPAAGNLYSITSMEPAVTGGDDDDYFYTTVGGDDHVYSCIAPGTKVYLNAHTSNEEGRTFTGWTVTNASTSATVTVVNPTAGDGTAYFEMPSYNVSVVANFCTVLTGLDVSITDPPSSLTPTSVTLNWSLSDVNYFTQTIQDLEGAENYSSATYKHAYTNRKVKTRTFDDLTPLTQYWVYVQGIDTCGSRTVSNVTEYTFTTPGYTVTYNTNGGGGTTPTDATEYANSASVTLLNKNINTSITDKYFAGWTDNSSGTGTIYKPGDTYTITSNVTFYAKWIDCSSSNTPQDVTITNDNTSSVTVSWDAVTDATKYVVEILGDALSEKHEFEVTTTSKTITISDASPDDYLYMITPYIGDMALCPSGMDFFTLAAGCPNYSFHYQHSSDWNTDDICFTQVSTSVNYLTDELSLPYAEWYNVTGSGNGGHGASDAYTYGFTGTTDNTPMPFYHYRSKSFGANPQSGNIGGGLGRFHVYGDSDSKNKYVSFIPTYYTLNFGTGDTWTNDSTLVLSPESSDWDETDFYTPITTLTNAAIGRKIFVGLKTSSGYVWCSPYSVKENLSGLRTKSGSGNNWVDGGLTTSYASKRGKFRVYANSGDNNWYVTFIPHHRIIYHANYPVGVSPADTYSVDVSVEETNSSIPLNSAPSAPTGYTFDGWYDAASGGNKKTGSQTISAGASADVELFAHWTLNTHSVTYSAPSNGDYTISVAGGSATSETKDADYGQTVTLAATGDTGYEFSSWTVTGATSGDEITVSNNQFTMPDEDVTVEATFTAIDYNVTYSAPSNGNYTISVAGGSASSSTQTANYGQTITLAATPSGGYQFSSWTIKNTSTSADVTGSVSLSSSTTSPATFTMPAYGVTVIATFEARNYTLTWDWNGGETSSTTHTAAGSVAYGTTIVYPANGTMSKEGHTFTGWSSTPATMPASNTTITAQWSVNSYNVAVANVDHVAITATPASELAIGEGSNRDVNYGKSVTLAYSSLESKNYWGGWKVTNAGGDDVTASVVDGNTLTVPDYAVTVSAVTCGDLVAWCDPQVEVSDGFCLTSYYVSGAASTTNSVYTTSAAGNLLTINSTDLGSVDKIEFSYLDGSDNTVTLTSSPFRLCNDGSSNYNVADGGAGSSYTKTGLSNTCDLSYSIRYKPTAYNLMDNYKLKMVFKKGTEVRKTIIREMNGRSLPEEFVIAAKFNGQWYALPNTLKGTQAEQGAITPIKITVDNTTTPTAATYAPTTTVYKGRAKYETSNPSSMALTSTGSNYLQTSSSNSVNQMWLSSSGYTGAVDWYFKSSDRSVYELAMDPVNTPTKKMGIDGGHMGYYGTPTISAIYLLPITNKIVDNPAIVTAWGQQSVILDVDAQTASSASVHLGVGDSEKAASFGETKTSVKNANSKYNYTLSFNTMDFSAHKGELLYVDWLDGDDNVVSTSTLTIPWIIAESSVMGEIDNVQAHWKDWEVHVLPGVTLEADGNSFSAASNVAKIKTLEIYPGATVNVSSGTLDVTQGLVLRNGWDRLNGEKKYDVARLYITPTNGNLIATNAYADWYIDFDQYYPVAVPWEVDLSANDGSKIWYKNTKSNAIIGASGSVRLRYYDGASRAANTNTGVGENSNWKLYGEAGCEAIPDKLEPSKAYAMTAKRPTGKAFSIIRMPLTIPSAEWTAGGEKGSVTIEAVTTHKDQVTVTAYGDENTPEYAKGWNFIANPYMSLHKGTLSYTDEGTIEYANIPDIDFKEYDQVPIVSSKLKPASGFLVQAP